jgi:hypothetical protein
VIVARQDVLDAEADEAEKTRRDRGAGVRRGIRLLAARRHHELRGAFEEEDAGAVRREHGFMAVATRQFAEQRCEGDAHRCLPSTVKRYVELHAVALERRRAGEHTTACSAVIHVDECHRARLATEARELARSERERCCEAARHGAVLAAGHADRVRLARRCQENGEEPDGGRESAPHVRPPSNRAASAAASGSNAGLCASA